MDWRWLAAAAALLIVLVAPFFLVDVPPVLDYPNHLARFFILAHPDDPVLSKMYAPHWTILPNLGMDIVGTGLLRLTDVHTGGRILLAASMLAPVAGAVIYHRAVFGQRSYWPLASGLIAFNGAFFLGFMNFLLSLGLALAGAAAWTALRRRNRSGWKALAGVIAAIATFFTHIFGLGLFLLLIGAEEAAVLWNRRATGTVKPRDAMAAIVPLLIALAPALVLYRLSPFGGTDTSFGPWRAATKVARLASPFATSNLILTAVTAAIVIIALVALRRRVALAPGLPLVFAVLVICFIAAPLTIKRGSFIDLRVELMVALLVFAGMQPRIARSEATALGLVFAAVILIRSAYVGATWIDHRHDLADLRAAIAVVEPGTRVLVATGYPATSDETNRAQRNLPGIYRMTAHLPALLAIERKAFWPLLFADPSQQPVTVLPPFDRLAQPLQEPVNWSVLSNEPYSADLLGLTRYLARWRSDFDYVLLIDPEPAFPKIAKLTPLYDGDFAKLYRIER